MKLDELKVVNQEINLDEYIKYREIVKQGMEHPEWLGDFTKKDLETMLNNNSKIWMFYKADDFVCSCMAIPSTKKDMNSFGIDLDYQSVVDYGPMFVMSKYVGKGLQYKMLKMIDSYYIKLGYKYAIGTVHPDNNYSINNLIKDEFSKIGQKEFKRGIRNIYIKDYKKEEK